MVRSRRYVAAVMLVLAASAVAACGGSDGSGGGGDAAGGAPGAGSDKDAPADDASASSDEDKGPMAVDPCEIVTAGEIEEVLGTGPVQEGQPNAAFCSWPVGTGGLDTVAVSLTDTTQYGSTAEEGMNSMREGFGAAAVDIAGLGDEAVGDGAGMLAFRTGDWYATTMVLLDQDPGSNQSMAEELAHIVLDRL